MSGVGVLQASGAAWHVHSHNNFEGKALYVFVMSSVAFATILNVLGSVFELLSSAVIQLRYLHLAGRCLDTIVHREALREIARASPVESVTKVQSAIEWLKGNSELPPKGMDNYPKVCDIYIYQLGPQTAPVICCPVQHWCPSQTAHTRWLIMFR